MNFEDPHDSSPGHGLVARTVMVVDDDRLVLLTLAHGLRQAGFEVLEADNGDEAILMARAYRPALALLDIRMQGLSGFDVAQHLKDYAQIPFLFISAYDDEDTRRQARALGAVACLSKPVNLRELIRLVHDTLEPPVDPPVEPSVEPPVELPSTPTAGSMPLLDKNPEPPIGRAPGGWPAAAEVPMAMGLLMQRDRVTQDAAWQQLQDMAARQQVSIEQAASALLALHDESLRLGGQTRSADRNGGRIA